MNVTNILYIFIRELFNIPPVIILCYLPFYKKLTKPGWKVVAQLVAIYLLFSVPGVVFVAMGLSGFADITATSFVVAGYFYFSKTVGESRQKRNFIFCVGVYAGGTAHGITSIFNMIDLWGSIRALAGVPVLLSFILARVVIYLVIGLILHYVITPRMRRVRAQDMDLMWVIPLMFSVLTYFYAIGRSMAGIVDYVFPIVFSMLTIISFVVFYMVIRMLERAGINAQLEIEIAAANEQQRSLTAEKAVLENLARMKTEYLANMSHETKAPLTIISVHVQRAAELFEEIRGSTNMFEEYETTKGELARKSDKIGGSLIRAQEEVKRAAQLAENALRLASLQESREQMAPLEIASLLKDIAEGYRPILEQRGNNIILDIKPNMQRVMGNTSQMVQVMTNLLTNANTHTQNGAITISANHIGDNIRIAVKDTGSGVSPGIMPRIFERGVTGGTGTGVGLAIAKDIVEAHGGAIAIDTDSKGTVVSFTLPVFYTVGG